MPAPAKRNSRPPTQPERLPLLIHNLEIPFNSQRTVIEDRYFCACQSVLRRLNLNESLDASPT